MTDEQAMELLNKIHDNYPDFELSPEIIEFWTRMLVDISYEDVDKRLNEHIKIYNRIPAICELRGTCEDEILEH